MSISDEQNRKNFEQLRQRKEQELRELVQSLNESLDYFEEERRKEIEQIEEIYRTFTCPDANVIGGPAPSDVISEIYSRYNKLMECRGQRERIDEKRIELKNFVYNPYYQYPSKIE